MKLVQKTICFVCLRNVPLITISTLSIVFVPRSHFRKLLECTTQFVQAIYVHAKESVECGGNCKLQFNLDQCAVVCQICQYHLTCLRPFTHKEASRHTDAE
jgi:hypothetical protein